MTVSMEERPSFGYTFFFLKQIYLCNYNSNPVKLLIEVYGKFPVILNLLYANKGHFKMYM